LYAPFSREKERSGGRILCCCCNTFLTSVFFYTSLVVGTNYFWAKKKRENDDERAFILLTRILSSILLLCVHWTNSLVPIDSLSFNSVLVSSSLFLITEVERDISFLFASYPSLFSVSSIQQFVSCTWFAPSLLFILSIVIQLTVFVTAAVGLHDDRCLTMHPMKCYCWVMTSTRGDTLVFLSNNFSLECSTMTMTKESWSKRRRAHWTKETKV
jgi:hypothetical protein